METYTQQTFLNEASFEVLLGTRPFLILDNGLLFYHEQLEKYVIATFDPNTEYTVADYYQLPEEVPFQLINGKFVQTMGASLKHQEVSGNLYSILNFYIREHQLGKVFHAPTDVVFEGEDGKNVFQPDILFISVGRKSQLEENRIMGAPKFVVEILSKSTEDNDRTIKMEKYGEYDVVEYWIVHPTEEYIEVYHNFEKELKLVQTATTDDTIVSKAIEGFKLKVGRIFE